MQAKQTTKNDDGEEVEAEAAGPINNLPDIQADAKVWALAGVGFGEYETMLLQKSLKELVTTSGAAVVRLWGKIRGT